MWEMRLNIHFVPFSLYNGRSNLTWGIVKTLTSEARPHGQSNRLWQVVQVVIQPPCGSKAVHFLPITELLGLKIAAANKLQGSPDWLVARTAHLRYLLYEQMGLSHQSFPMAQGFCCCFVQRLMVSQVADALNPSTEDRLDE